MTYAVASGLPGFSFVRLWAGFTGRMLKAGLIWGPLLGGPLATFILMRGIIADVDIKPLSILFSWQAFVYLMLPIGLPLGLMLGLVLGLVLAMLAKALPRAMASGHSVFWLSLMLWGLLGLPLWWLGVGLSSQIRDAAEVWPANALYAVLCLANLIQLTRSLYSARAWWLALPPSRETPQIALALRKPAVLVLAQSVVLLGMCAFALPESTLLWYRFVWMLPRLPGFVLVLPGVGVGLLLARLVTRWRQLVRPASLQWLDWLAWLGFPLLLSVARRYLGFEQLMQAPSRLLALGVAVLLLCGLPLLLLRDIARHAAADAAAAILASLRRLWQTLGWMLLIFSVGGILLLMTQDSPDSTVNLLGTAWMLVASVFAAGLISLIETIWYYWEPFPWTMATWRRLFWLSLIPYGLVAAFCLGLGDRVELNLLAYVLIWLAAWAWALWHWRRMLQRVPPLAVAQPVQVPDPQQA